MSKNLDCEVAEAVTSRPAQVGRGGSAPSSPSEPPVETRGSRKSPRGASLTALHASEQRKAPRPSANADRSRRGRLAVSGPEPKGGFIAPTSRPLYTSRTRRGPLLAPSEKSGGHLCCESLLEGTFVAATRFDTRVRQALAQPLVMDVVSGITAATGDLLRKRLVSQGYAPSDAVLWFVDFELEIVGSLRPIYVEVKPAQRAGDVAQRLEARAQACERIGVGFMLVLDSDFQAPLSENLHILKRYAGTPLPESLNAKVRQAMQHGPMRLCDLAAATGAGLAELYGLVSAGHLGWNMRGEPLCPRATVHASDPAHRCILDLPE